MKKRAPMSLKKRIITILQCLLIPMVLMLNLYTLYINVSFTGQLAQLHRAQLEAYVGRVSIALDMAEKAIGDIISSNSQFRQLVYPLQPTLAYSNAYSAHLACKSVVMSQRNVAGVALYSPLNELYLPAWRENFAGTQRILVKRAIRQYLLNLPKLNETHPNAWVQLDFEGESFLCLLRLIENQGQPVYLFCLIDLAYLAENEDPPVALARDDLFLTSRNIAEENALSVPPSGARYVTQGTPSRYMLLSQNIPATTLQAVTLIPYSSLYLGIGPFQVLLGVISILAVLLVPLGYWWLSRALFRPMDKLVAVMETAASGDLNVRADNHYTERELKIMSDTFNTMMEQISALKIEAYESELDAQRAQLSFLQMQIRPHFYLNCMKNLYGMAQEHQYSDIQQMLVFLSDYLRYMMQSNTHWVTLEDELQNSRNYIRLQQFNQAYPPECRISVDATALNVRIPPITILTFVENCMKHAVPNSQLIIQLRVRRLTTEDGAMLLLSIHDNGQGFPPKLLNRLNHLDEMPLDADHVGISNVWKRLKLFYKTDCGIVLSNENGAVVELFLPIGDEHDATGS